MNFRASVAAAVTEADTITMIAGAKHHTIYQPDQVRGLLALEGEELRVDYPNECWRLQNGTAVSGTWEWRCMLEFHRQGEDYRADVPQVWIGMHADHPKLYFVFPFKTMTPFPDLNGQHMGSHPECAFYLPRLEVDMLLDPTLTTRPPSAVQVRQ